MAFERMTENVMNISGLPNVVVGQASMLKNTFDKSGKDMKTFINNFLDVLESQIASQSIGASVETVPEKTVQAILTAFESEILNRYTKSETDTLVSTDTNNLIEDFDINLTTGVITITKKDGTTETFDTAIEKVPATFEIVESGTSVFLKITNVDGTSTQTDITELMNVYEFVNTDDIAFTMTGTGNEKKVTANIRNNSIGIEKFSLSVISQFEGYVTSASNSATQAQGYAQQANTSKEQAASSASQATNQANNAQSSATSASNSANTATTKASEASTSASLASTKAKTAESYAHGGTGTRQGEDTDNAKYYAQIAKEVAGGDFVTPTEMEAYAQPLGTTPTFETTELSGQEIEVETPLAMESVLQLSGNSEQDSRSGKNKLDVIAETITKSGVTFTINDNKSITLNGTSTETIYFNLSKNTGVSATYFTLTNGKQYTSYLKNAVAGVILITRSNSQNLPLIQSESGKEITTQTYNGTTDNEAWSYLQVPANTTFNNLTVYPMILEGEYTLETAEPYEPYGVQPSPDYPSEIRSVTELGQNLLKLKSGTETADGVTFTYNEDGSVTLSGTAEQGNHMYLLADLTNAPIVFKGGSYYTQSITVVSGSFDGISFTTLAKGETNLQGMNNNQTRTFGEDCTVIRTGITFVEGTVLDCTFFVQIERGDKATTWKPYGYVPVELKLEGRNVLPYPYENSTTTTGGITYTDNGDGSFTINGTATLNAKLTIATQKLDRGSYMLHCEGDTIGNTLRGFYNKDGVEIYIGSTAKGQLFALEDEYVVTFYLVILSGQTVNNLTVYPMLEEGDVAHEYEPYKTKTLSLPLGDIELRSTPDGTRDTFARVDGVWNKVENVRSFEYDGSDDENWVVYSDKIHSFMIQIGYTIQDGYCNYFSDIGSAQNLDTKDGIYLSYTGNFIVSMLSVTTIEEFKEWINTHKLEIITHRQDGKPFSYTPITDQALISALDELEQLILHKGYNYITATSVNGVKAQLDLFIPSTASVTEVQETESSMDMLVLLAVGKGDVKPKVAKDKQMTFNATTGEAKINGEKVATEAYVDDAVSGKADKTYVDNAVSSIVVPNIQASTTDLEAGVSELPTGNIYFVYE